MKARFGNIITAAVARALRREMIVFLSIGFFFCSALPNSGYAEIRVSPVAVYLGDDNLNGRVAIQNGGSQSKEVEVDIQFGYPVSDDSGNVSFRFVKSLGSNEPSATDWVRIFPQRFILPPGESQTLIVIADPPAGLPEGEFWARPILTFQTVDAGSRRDGNDEPFQVVLSLNFRHGAVRTGVQLHSVSTQLGMQKANIIVDLGRLGNAAFIGNVVCRLRDETGRLMWEEKKELAVYHSLKQKIQMNVSGLESGKYSAEVELNTNRPGNNPGDILQASSVFGHSEIVIDRVIGKQPTRLSSGSQDPLVHNMRGQIASGPLRTTTNIGHKQKAIKDTLEKLRIIQADLGRMLDSLSESKGN